MILNKPLKKKSTISLKKIVDKEEDSSKKRAKTKAKKKTEEKKSNSCSPATRTHKGDHLWEDSSTHSKS